MTDAPYKPQAAIDAGLFSKEEASEYLGMSLGRFMQIAGTIPGIRLGAIKYYSLDALKAYVAGRVQTAPNANINNVPEIVA